MSNREVEVKTNLKNKLYEFDHAFGSGQSNSRVFEVGCRSLIEHVLEQTHSQGPSNYGLIFVYGNTGTGKTYSMGLLNTLHAESEGIVPNSIRFMFDRLARSEVGFEVSMSFSEIYLDEVYDLLAFEDDVRLAIREDSVGWS